jgi:hypothetical protein
MWTALARATVWQRKKLLLPLNKDANEIIQSTRQVVIKPAKIYVHKQPHVSNLDRTIGLAGCEDESCASDLGGEAMRGCGIPRGFWLKPGGSEDRVEGIIIETL